MKPLVIMLSIALGGCASLAGFTERHPVLVSASAIVLAGSIEAMRSAQGQDGRKAIPGNPCVTAEACR
jgi:hypothetical protein